MARPFVLVQRIECAVERPDAVREERPDLRLVVVEIGEDRVELLEVGIERLEDDGLLVALRVLVARLRAVQAAQELLGLRKRVA